MVGHFLKGGLNLPVEKKVTKKKKMSRILDGNKTISFGNNTSLLYPAEGISNLPVEKKVKKKKKCHGSDQKLTLLTLTANFPST